MEYLQLTKTVLPLAGLFPLMAEGTVVVGILVIKLLMISSVAVESVVASPVPVLRNVVVVWVPVVISIVASTASVDVGEGSCLLYNPRWAAPTWSQAMAEQSRAETPRRIETMVEDLSKARLSDLNTSPSLLAKLYVDSFSALCKASLAGCQP